MNEKAIGALSESTTKQHSNRFTRKIQCQSMGIQYKWID